MELKILDGVIHGDLKPWQIDLSNKKNFVALLTNANKATPKTTAELLTQIVTLLQDFPESKKKANALPKSKDTTLTTHFYKTELPPFTNSVSQFYSLLISKEALRFFNHLIEHTSKLPAELDVFFNVNNSLKYIRNLARQVNKEIQDLRKLAITEEQKELSEFALLTLKQTLIGLFFDIQERFKSSLKEVLSEDNFYILYLDETPPATTQLKPTVSLFEFQLTKLFADEYNEEAALELLKQMQNNPAKEMQLLQAALENYIFLQSQNIEITNRGIQQLTEGSKIKQHLGEAQAVIEKQINQYNYGHQRANALSDSIDELHYIHSGCNNKYSIPSLLRKWLEQQKEMYQQNANATFAKLTDADTEAARLKSPLSKKDKATIDQQKQYALEHLAFMNGYNIKNEKIMPDSDHNRMMEYTYHLIEKGKLPTGIKKIPQTGFAANGIRYTYYKIHEFLYGTQSIRKEWIDFLHAVFQQFKDTQPSTTKAKFSTKPKAYDADLKQMKR
jgi:hypothetical protein